MVDRARHTGAIVLSAALHVALVAALSLGVRFPTPARQAAAPAPIQGVIIDESQIRAEQERRDQAERVERERVARVERQKREAQERERREKEAAERREQERVAEERRKREQAEREERERIAAEKREQERIAQEKREREERERREREEAARKKREAELAAKQRAEAEAELQRSLAAERERAAAERAGLLDEYIRLIQNQIERNWIPPASAKPGIDCVVNVVQIPSGDVVDARVGRCNGDDAVMRSIEAAVRRASPLPKPRDPSLFERNLIVTFRPTL